MRFSELQIYHLVWEGVLVASWKTRSAQMNVVGLSISPLN